MTKGGLAQRTVPLVWAAAMVVAGCQAGSPTAVEADLDRPFDIRVGQEVTLDGGSIAVRFAGVAEDSRCPVDAVCIWQGNARLNMSAAVDGAPHDLVLNTAGGPHWPREAVADGYAIELLELHPEPRTGRSIPLWAYRAVLRVSPVAIIGAAGAAP